MRSRVVPGDVFDQRRAPAHQAVEQRRLADVRPPDDGDDRLARRGRCRRRHCLSTSAMPSSAGIAAHDRRAGRRRDLHRHRMQPRRPAPARRRSRRSIPASPPAASARRPPASPSPRPAASPPAPPPTFRTCGTTRKVCSPLRRPDRDRDAYRRAAAPPSAVARPPAGPGSPAARRPRGCRRSRSRPSKCRAPRRSTVARRACP